MIIDEFKFGSFRIDGRTYLSDIKVINSAIKYWSGMEKHELQLESVRDLITPIPDMVIIGTGAAGLVNVSMEVKMFFMQNRIPVIVEKTDTACKEFNKAVKNGKKVNALLISTC